MALVEDLFKGNVLTGVVIGLGAVLLAPNAGQVLRPAAKAIIKSGMNAYQYLAEIGEMAGDLVAEVGAELAQQGGAEVETASRAGSTGRSKPKDA